MQKVVQDIIERLNKNLDKQETLRQELANYKDGHLQMKKRNGKIYYYLEYRVKNKVHTDYLGKENSGAVKKYLDNMSKIMDIKSDIDDLKIEEKELKSVLKKLKVKNYRYIYTIHEIRKIIKPILKKYNIENIYIFGSYARGEATKDSDLDLLVDLPNKREAYKFEEDVIKAFGKEADFVYDGDVVLNQFLNRIEKEMIFIGKLS